MHSSNKTENSDFPDTACSKTMLEILQKELLHEEERKKSLDTRSGIGISLVSAFLVFILSKTLVECTYDKIDFMYRNFFHFLCLLFLFLTIAGLLISLHYFVLVLSISGYKRLLLNDITSLAKMKENEYLANMSFLYKGVIGKYDNINTDKADKFASGLKGVKLSLFSYILAYFMAFLIYFFRG